jgi:hypothetical protein
MYSFFLVKLLFKKAIYFIFNSFLTQYFTHVSYNKYHSNHITVNIIHIIAEEID